MYFYDVHFCVILHPTSDFCEQQQQKKTTSHLSSTQNRVSVGLEHIDDIKADFEQAIEIATK